MLHTSHTLESPKNSRINKRGFTKTSKQPHTNPGQWLQPAFILSQTSINDLFRKGLYSEQYGYDLHHIFQAPLTTNCTGLLHLTLTNASYSWRLRSNANLIALRDGFQARDGRNQCGDLDMPGDFMHCCADALLNYTDAKTWRTTKLGIKWTIHVEVALTKPKNHGQNG